jgi:hypothetical protein
MEYGDEDFSEKDTNESNVEFFSRSLLAFNGM